MCKSFWVSAITGIYSYSIAFYLWRRNGPHDRPISAFVAVFSTIQWIEALLWHSLQTGSIDINRSATSALPFVLAMEPLASLWVGSRYYRPGPALVMAYLFSAAMFIFRWFSYGGSNPTDVDPRTGSLRWGGRGIDQAGRFLFLLLLVLPMLPMLHIWNYAIIVTGCIVTFAYSFLYGETFGSNWCWLANFLVLFQLIGGPGA